jgi:outer membrane protein OmpA-like peptidoglycan-associated protein
MNNRKDSFWIPYADLMTVLMVIFLFISLAIMVTVQREKRKQDEIFEEYQATKDTLYNELYAEFKDNFTNWSLELDKDLSIKFTNPSVLFKSGSSEITPTFKNILADFFPKYLRVVMQDKYENKIAEIRIEGHTDDVPINFTNDPYIDNVQLSQDRSRNVLAYLRQLPYYSDSLSPEKEQRLRYWLTANGLSYGRTLDNNKQYTYNSKQPINKEISRRVEFRIITTSENLVEEVIKRLNQ